MFRIRLLVFLFFIPGPSLLLAQSPRFYLGFDQILDNREYFTPYGYHQTIFGARINPGVAFHLDTLHQLRAGINYMFEYGGDLLAVRPQPELYYHYRGERLHLRTGAFPREELTEYPLVLLTDTLRYYRPHMEGGSVRYRWKSGWVHGWVDWTGREDTVRRESILAGIDARIRYRFVYLEAFLTRYHRARTTSPSDENRLRDDGSVMVLAGADLSGLSGLRSFREVSLSTGYLGTYEWERPEPNRWFRGWYSKAELRAGVFGFSGVYYRGDPPPLRYGDPLFRSGNYGRLDLFADPFTDPRIRSRIGWSFHLIPGEGLYHSMQLLISVRIP